MTHEETLKKLGKTIQAHRHQEALSVEQFSEASGLEEWFLKELEKGKIDPTMEHLFLIARGLGISMGELFKDFD